MRVVFARSVIIIEKSSGRPSVKTCEQGVGIREVYSGRSCIDRKPTSAELTVIMALLVIE